MRALVRESIAARLLGVPRLVERYQSSDAVYVEETLVWLAGTAELLQRLRHPSAAVVAAGQAKLLAARDGFRPDGVNGTSTRKSVRATAAIVIGEVTAVLRAEVDEIDRHFDEMTDRMAQLLAVVSAERPIPLPAAGSREGWLDDVWRSLQNGNGGAGMYGYLNARLNPSDRRYLLEQLLANVLGDAAAPQGSDTGSKPAESPTSRSRTTTKQATRSRSATPSKPRSG